MPESVENHDTNEYDFLIVEHHPGIIEFYDDFKDNHEEIGSVEFAEDYESALEAFNEEYHDVVVTGRTQKTSDIEDGLEFLDILRKEYSSDVVAGVTSGYPSDMDRGTNLSGKDELYDFYISSKGWEAVLEQI